MQLDIDRQTQVFIIQVNRGIKLVDDAHDDNEVDEDDDDDNDNDNNDEENDEVMTSKTELRSFRATSS